jgi:hypothetical protein
MKIITCTGYYGTGSSIISDLLKEFECCYSLGDYEFRFIQDPDGISDLDYNLVENNHRHNSGYALKKYEKLVKFLSGNILVKKYEIFFDNKFYLESKKYIENLKDLEWRGMWHEDVRSKGILFYYLERTANKIVSKTNEKILGKKERGFTFLKNEKTYYSYPREKFYLYTKEYIDTLFTIANKSNKEYVVVDQLVPPSNLQRYNKYFNNIKIIVVDRDPRDCYLLEKLYYKGTIVPVENVKSFIKWYKLVRQHRKYERDPENVLRINFEEGIYDYTNFLEKVLKFLNLKENEHKQYQKYFNPSISIKNTKLWEKHPEYQKDIQLIKEELYDYCWRYEEN